MEEKNYNLDFMYDKIAVPKMTMVYWLSIPEFSNAIYKHISNNETINNKLVYGIIKDIYFPHKKIKDELGSKADDFDHYRTKKGLKSLSKLIHNDEKYWEKEYDAYILS